MRESVTQNLNEDLWSYRSQVTWHDCPHLKTPPNLRIRNAAIKHYGATSSYIRSYLNGDFGQQDEDDFLFDEDDLTHIRMLMKDPPDPIHTGRIRLAADVSGGGDEQVVYARDGTDATIYHRIFHERDTSKLARILVDIGRSLGVPPTQFYIDNGGLGYSIIDEMEGETLRYRGIHRYMNNQAPYYKCEWADRITQDHFLFKEMMYRSPLALPKDETLRKEMRQRQWIMDDHNKVKLEPKPRHRKRLKTSPNRLETLIMLFADFTPPKGPPGPDKEPEYESPLEQEAAAISGRGSNRAFGGMMTQADSHSLAAMRGDGARRGPFGR